MIDTWNAYMMGLALFTTLAAISSAIEHKQGQTILHALIAAAALGFGLAG
jgi:hypothetical protein